MTFAAFQRVRHNNRSGRMRPRLCRPLLCFKLGLILPDTYISAGWRTSRGPTNMSPLRTALQIGAGGLRNGHLSSPAPRASALIQPRSRRRGRVEVDDTALHRARPPHRRGQEGLEPKGDQTHPPVYLPQARKQVRTLSTASIGQPEAEARSTTCELLSLITR